ncbi:MAG: DUF1579 family protein [Planctomycetaceae bacterium]
MRNHRFSVGLVAYATATAQTQTAVSSDESAKPRRTPTQILGLNIGSWDVEATIIQPQDDGSTRKQTNSYVVHNRWSSKQQFIIGTNTNDDGIWIGTYDPHKQNYRYAFVSPYFTSNFSGDWDDAKQTMTFKGKHDDGNTMTGTERIIDNDHRESVLKVMTDGRLVLELRHKYTRRKK